MTDPERRRSSRVTFDEPPRGKVGAISVSVLDVGLQGSKLEHQPVLPVGSTVEFSFTWEGHTLEFSAKIVRCVLQGFKEGKKVFHSGLDFVELRGDAESHLHRLVLGESSTDDAPAATELPSPALQPAPFMRFDDDELLELVAAEEAAAERRQSSQTAFVECRLHENGTWTRTPVAEPTSPADGFTVPRPENERELDLLCNAYAKADPQARLKIRASLESRARRSS